MTSIARVSYLGAPRLDEDLVDVFRAGRLGDVLDFTRAGVDGAGSLLRARAFARLGLPADALEATNTNFGQASNVLKAERALIRAVAHGRLGEFADAAEELTNARGYGLGSPFRSVENDIGYTGAFLAFMAGDVARAEDLIDIPVAFESDHARFGLAEKPLFDGNHVAARRYELRAALAARSGDHLRQTAFFKKALRSALSSKPHDVWLIGSIATNYAITLREYLDGAAMKELQSDIAGLAWPSDLARFRFEIARAGGMSAALSGDQLAAFASYRESAKHAPSLALRVMAMIDRVHLSRELGMISGDFLRDEVHEIAELASRVDWHATVGEEYVSLLLLAQLFASVEPATAAAYFERYKAMHARASRELVGRGDPRRTAAELAVLGSIAKARGERALAISTLERACKTYADLNCEWRAGMVAIELLELDPIAQPARDVAMRVAAAAPASWIARRLHRVV